MRLAVFLLVVALGILAILLDPQHDPAIGPREFVPAWPHTDADDWRYPPRVGMVMDSVTGARVIDKRFERQLRRYEPASHGYTFKKQSDSALTYVAVPAVDGRLHSPQAFLLGRAPYAVDQAWMPLYAISERMRYQLDKQQFRGREEVWLTTLQAWSHAKGDCEDHAIPLADWLIELGLDARVVLGMHRREGHAWVVVFKEGQEYLLEATDKTKVKNWSAYPLAKLLPDYHPEMMFNRETLWVNTGSALTVNYTGPQWQATLSFNRACGATEVTAPGANCGQ